MLRTWTLACLSAGIAIGCNHDNVRQEQQEERNELAREQSEEHREHAENQHNLDYEHAELARDQQHERTELRHDQTAEQHEQRADAREDLVDKTNEVAASRETLGQDVRELNTLVTQACAGVPEAERSLCPLTSTRVERVTNMTDGVRLVLMPSAGTKASMEERVGCYRARAEIRQSAARLTPKTSPAPGAPVATPSSNANSNGMECVLDQSGLELAVEEADGHIEVELTTETAAQVRELRAQARLIVPTAAPQASNNATRSASNANASNANATTLR